MSRPKKLIIVKFPPIAEDKTINFAMIGDLNRPVICVIRTTIRAGGRGSPLSSLLRVECLVKEKRSYSVAAGRLELEVTSYRTPKRVRM